MGTIQLDAQMPARFGLTYMGADNHEHPVVRHPPRAARLARAVHRDPDRALRRRFPLWLAPVQVRVLPVGERHRERAARARAKRSRAPASGSRSTTATRRSASGSATRSSRRSRTSSSGATASPTRRSPSATRRRGPVDAVARRAARRAEIARAELAPRRLCEPPVTLLRSLPASRSGIAPHLAGPSARAGFNRVGSDEGTVPLHAAAFRRYE